MHLANFPESEINEIRENLRIPEGTFSFRYTSDQLFDELVSGILFEIATGEIIYRLERDENFDLKYYRSSPGTGTKVASVNIKELSYSEGIRLFMTWSPDNINLYVGSTTGDKKLLQGEGKDSNKQFRVAPDGSIIQIGDEHANVMEFEMYVDGKPFIQPSAIDNWKSKINAINLLFNSKSESNELKFETVITNMALVILVTGFESYCKTRFLEMEKEGKKLNFPELLKSFSSQIEKENNIEEYIYEKSEEHKTTPLKYIVDRKRIDFQNFKRCNNAYKKGYNISFFEDLGIPVEQIDLIKQVIQYRHRIVHYSMYEGLFNMGDHGAEPIFTRIEFGRRCVSTFENFINLLHQKTF